MSTRKCRTCLLCPRKAAPGSDVCTACYWQEFSKIEHARICAIRSAFRGAKLRAEREQERR